MINKIPRQLIPQRVSNMITKKNNAREVIEWKKNGCPPPAPHNIKQQTIKEYQEKYSSKILVETGTYMGDMVEAQKGVFMEVYSIELGDKLFKTAKRRFRKDKNVTIVHGDSGKVLPSILMKINEPAIFWLDGHYSAGITARGDKDCPIFEELDAIFSENNFEHVLLIDDARCFNGEGDYPTIEELTDYVKSKNEKYIVEVKDDIIRFAI